MRDVDPRMARVTAALERDLAKIRAGGASGSLLDGITVDHAGRRLPLDAVASVTVPDPRQIVIRPWDPRSLRAIGTAISHSRLGLTPTIDGGTIRLFVPAMTAERREALVGLVRERVERAHVEIRTIRHETLAAIRSRERAREIGADERRRDEIRLRRATDDATATIARLGQAKADDLRRV